MRSCTALVANADSMSFHVRIWNQVRHSSDLSSLIIIQMIGFDLISGKVTATLYFRVYVNEEYRLNR